MKKSELINYLALKQDIPVQEAHRVVEVIFESMAQALEQGKRVELRGFGSFRVKRYDGYTGRNPKTGEAVAVPPKSLVLFKMGKELIEKINQGHPQRKESDSSAMDAQVTP